MTKQNTARHFTTVIITFMLVFITLPAMADDTGFDDNVDDEVETPINSFILPVLTAAIAIGYILTGKKQNTI